MTTLPETERGPDDGKTPQTRGLLAKERRVIEAMEAQEDGMVDESELKARLRETRLTSELQGDGIIPIRALFCS